MCLLMVQVWILYKWIVNWQLCYCCEEIRLLKQVQCKRYHRYE